MSTVPAIFYSQYSEKSYLIFGDTKSIKEQIKELGCKWNSKLKGWIVSKKQFDFSIKTELSKISNLTESEKVPDLVTTPTNTTTTNTNTVNTNTTNATNTTNVTDSDSDSEFEKELREYIKKRKFEKLQAIIDRMTYMQLDELYSSELSGKEFIEKIVCNYL